MDNWVLNLPRQNWSTRNCLFRFFEPTRNVVVLANSNTPEREVHENVCAELDVPILRRKGGGGTVVLTPGCLILTFAFFAKDLFGNARYFKVVNDLWIESLAEVGVHGLAQNGISDIVSRDASGDKKVAGTSIFRKKHLLVYQGSLLVNPNFELIKKCLQHPSKEPEYRSGREHGSFLTSLKEMGCSLDTSALQNHCSSYFSQHVEERLCDEIWAETF